MANFFTKIFGTHSSHELKKIYPIADKVEALEEQFKKLSDEELRAKTDEFKKRYQDGETLDQLLPEAFATCREASWRVLGMRHYRVQIIGGIVLHRNRQRLPRQARQRVDGQGLPLPRSERRSGHP